MMKVDILIPTYNVENTIERSLNSLLSQTFSNYDIHILDDCSTDKTLERVETLLAPLVEEGRVRIEKNDINQGIGLNRNKLIEMSKSPLCCWFDADDYMYPNKLQAQVDYFNHNSDCNFLATEMFGFFPNTPVVIDFPNKAFMVENLTLEKLQHSNCINNPTVMFRPEAVKELGGYKDMRAEEDWDLWRRVYENGGKINCLPRKLLLYTLPHGSPNNHKHGEGGSK